MSLSRASPVRPPARMVWLFCAMLLTCGEGVGSAADGYAYVEGGIVRGEVDTPELALVFTGDEYADGGDLIRSMLRGHDVPASFFFTGRFYRNPAFHALITGLKKDGHYLGAHSDQHLLYCSWEDRDRLLVTRDSFVVDLLVNYQVMENFGIKRPEAKYFMPPYEWYNETVSAWTEELGLTLVNFTPGTRSNADYTTPDMGDRYVSSDSIFSSILSYESQDPNGLNGFILLLHVGTAPERTDKFYVRLGELVTLLRQRGYAFARIDDLLTRQEP